MNAGPRVRAMIDGIIDREGGYVDNPNDPGGETKFGITKAVARVNGYNGEMRDFPRSLAEKIYLDQYFIGPGFNRVADLSAEIAEEITDTGVNMGIGRAGEFLQRALNAFNLDGKLYADLKVDGAVGNQTLAALHAYLEKRGADGVKVMLTALNCLQGAAYLDLARTRPGKFEAFIFGWLKNRVTL